MSCPPQLGQLDQENKGARESSLQEGMAKQIKLKELKPEEGHIALGR
jgi:hypothetical protein